MLTRSRVTQPAGRRGGPSTLVSMAPNPTLTITLPSHGAPTSRTGVSELARKGPDSEYFRLVSQLFCSSAVGQKWPPTTCKGLRVSGFPENCI